MNRRRRIAEEELMEEIDSIEAELNDGINDNGMELDEDWEDEGIEAMDEFEDELDIGEDVYEEDVLDEMDEDIDDLDDMDEMDEDIVATYRLAEDDEDEEDDEDDDDEDDEGDKKRRASLIREIRRLEAAIDNPEDDMGIGQDHDVVEELMDVDDMTDSSDGGGMLPVVDTDVTESDSDKVARLMEASRRLDRVANALERRGGKHVKIAYHIDQIADAIDRKRRSL